MNVVIREYNPKIDNPYIYSTWTKYSWYSPSDIIIISKKKWFQDKIRRIQKCLALGTIKIACLDETPSVIMGYIVVMNRQMEWICIKKEFRDNGIEQLLFKSVKDELEEEEPKETQEPKEEESGTKEEERRDNGINITGTTPEHQ